MWPLQQTCGVDELRADGTFVENGELDGDTWPCVLVGGEGGLGVGVLWGALMEQVVSQLGDEVGAAAA